MSMAKYDTNSAGKGTLCCLVDLLLQRASEDGVAETKLLPSDTPSGAADELLKYPIPVFISDGDIRQGGGNPKPQFVVNNVDPPEVVRVKLHDSKTHVVEQVLIDVMGILPIVDIAAKIGKGMKLAAKGLEFFTKVLASNDLIFTALELSKDKDAALYTGDRVAHRPNREGKVLTDNYIIVERFRINAAGGLTIQEYKKKRAGEETYHLAEVFQKGDNLGFAVKDLYFRRTEPRRGFRLKTLNPADAAASVASYNKADVTGCICKAFPCIEDGNGSYGHRVDWTFGTPAAVKGKMLQDLGGDPGVRPYMYCWLKSSELWQTVQPPENTKLGKIGVEYQYSIHSHVG
ncbi:hypothetical protein DL768_006799 [Monosporascus sp. mg162]|nr:hypothetical protein DL768_006799 [Monosporascus sp. mg162]